MRMRKATIIASAMAAVIAIGVAPAQATKQSKDYTIPGGQGTLTSNAWRTSGNGSVSGNTRQWEYQVSASYSGSKTVQRIRTTWASGASLKNSASISVSVSTGGISYATSSSWQTVETPEKYWENSNGARTSSWRSNIVVAPSKYYLSDTIYIRNTAMVKLSSDARTFQISASA